ncbi:MAG: hypothetical protein ABSG60_11060 [Terracidiphilus sp.]|jgi:hypothetical protein
MCLNQRKKPIVTLPIGTIFLAIAIIWPKIIHPSSMPGQNWDDFLRGGIFGIAIGMLLMTGIKMRRQRSCE